MSTKLEKLEHQAAKLRQQIAKERRQSAKKKTESENAAIVAVIRNEFAVDPNLSNPRFISKLVAVLSGKKITAPVAEPVDPKPEGIAADETSLGV